MKTTLRHLFQLSLCMLLLASVASANPTAFEEAQRSGEDVPGGSLHWTFRWDGKPVTVNTDGKGSVDGKEFQVPLNSTRLTARLFHAETDGDLLLLVEETDEESGAGKLVRFTKKTMKPKWTCSLPGINVGPGLVDGKSAYLSARATAMRVNLQTGQWDWRKTNLNRTDESTAYRFNAFEVPTLDGDNVTFPEAGTSGSITFRKTDGEIVEIR